MEARVSDAGSNGASAPSGFFKGVSFVGLFGVLGTLIAAYFQNLSTYGERSKRALQIFFVRWIAYGIRNLLG
jgi:hypothetical protein